MRISRIQKTIALSALFLNVYSNSWADDYHHKNVLIGERAAGLAGAFTAMSDDPSGIYYNPAGLAFVFENYVSLSANAWASTKYVFKDVVEGQDYTLNSAALVPAYFGFTQSVGRTKWAFAIVVPNSDLIDQNDTLNNFVSSTGQNYITRRYYKIDNTYFAGPAVGIELADNMSAGVSLMGNFRLFKSIDNQIGAFQDGSYFTQNSYLEVFSKQFSPKLGVQWMPAPKLSLGASVGMDFSLGATATVRRVGTTQVPNTNPVDYVTQTGVFSNDISDTGEQLISYSPINFMRSSFGVAWFASKSFLLSADVDIIYPLNSSSHKLTFNESVGVEWYVNDGMPVRLGLMTNNSSASDSGIVGEATSVNFYSVTSGVSWVGGGSSFSLGFAYGLGSGEGRVTGSGVQKVEGTQYSIFLQGSYQL
jgi:hypothetical protein